VSGHSNRGTKGPFSNPTPDEVRSARETAGLTQTQAAEMVRGTLRAWQGWEAPEGEPAARRMHPGLWELFHLKTKT
jgi:putative transcriptional regulator